MHRALCRNKAGIHELRDWKDEMKAEGESIHKRKENSYGSNDQVIGPDTVTDHIKQVTSPVGWLPESFTLLFISTGTRCLPAAAEPDPCRNHIK